VARLLVFGTALQAVEADLRRCGQAWGGAHRVTACVSLPKHGDSEAARLASSKPGLTDAYAWSCRHRLQRLRPRVEGFQVGWGGDLDALVAAVRKHRPDVLVLSDGWPTLLVPALGLGPEVWLCPQPGARVRAEAGARSIRVRADAAVVCTDGPPRRRAGRLLADAQAGTEVVAARRGPMEQLRLAVALGSHDGVGLVLPGPRASTAPPARWWAWPRIGRRTPASA
jgi:hypothetical protein